MVVKWLEIYHNLQLHIGLEQKFVAMSFKIHAAITSLKTNKI